MINIKEGYITEEIFSRPGIKGYWVNIEGKMEKCIAYPDLLGIIELGDRVSLNTTANTLNLGSGGYHYIIANLSNSDKELTPKGHIMKLRYTPMQVKVLSVEEEESPYHEEMLKANSLDNTPVLVGTLHSMLAPLSLLLGQEDYKIAYLMTDGAALPLAFSHNVHELKKRGLLHGTVTVGHAFGGDLEAVNIYSGLLAAKTIFEPDIIIVTMGPGIVGTGNKWGFTGIEQGEILNAVEALNGIPICLPRISFADTRDRHRGISHHTLTVLSRVCRVKAIVPLPDLGKEKLSYMLEQIRFSSLVDKYDYTLEMADDTLKIMQKSNFQLTTMGRTLADDKEFFLTLGAASLTASNLLRGKNINKLTLV
ncbi:MAG TPA: DUF3866 family protein [Syntrophomonadaceae bacterium]|nr:DUF3866 family protein [Syntrophomonadaceae bacterium]